MRKKLIVANWKMNGTLATITHLLNEIIANTASKVSTECVILPPALYLAAVEKQLMSTDIRWGAQNVYPKSAGAYTGEVSATMLSDFNCDYVLVGHSERRTKFNESEKFVADKFHHVKEHGMIPLLCIGESLEQRNSGLTEQVLAQQLVAIVERNKDAFRKCVIAYEPIWAIGTGQSASPEQVQEVHKIIRKLIAEYSISEADKVSILYGGSVTPANAKSLFAMSEVDGGLIGGASLHAQQFADIFKCIN